jgi:tetratricopeptide (TPR) repeat protein
LTLNDKDYKVWGNLASVYVMIPEKQDKVVQTYRRAIWLAERLLKVNPRDPELLSHLGEFQASIGEYSRAVELTEQALTIAPQNILIVARAGLVYEKIGNRNKARELIARAVNEGYPITYIEREPAFMKLIADPAFLELIENGASGL